MKSIGAGRSVANSGAARIFRAVARVGSLLLAARFFPMEAVGDFAFLLGTGTLAAGILDFGVTTLLQRERGRAGAQGRELEARALALRMITLIPAIGVGWGVAALILGRWNPFDLGTLTFAAAVSLVDFLAGVHRARGDFRGEAVELGSLLVAVLFAFAAQVFLRLPFDSFQVLLGGTAGALGLVRALWLRRGLAVRRARPASGGGIRNLLWTSRWMWAMALGSLLLFELPVVLLRTLAPAADVALFAAAQRATGLASQPFAVLSGVFIPAMAWSQGEDRYNELLDRLNRLHVLSMPAMLAASLVAGALLLRGFGSTYTSALPLVWLLAAGTLTYLGAPSSGHLLLAGQERALAFVSLTAAAGLTVLLYLLTPSFGLVGGTAGVALALVGGKLGHGILYRLTGRAPVNRDLITAGILIVLWLVILAFVGPRTRWLALAVGGVISASVSGRLLLGTRLAFAPLQSDTSSSKSGSGMPRSSRFKSSD